MHLNIKFHQFPCISSWDTVYTKFWTHTDRHFLKTVKSCSGHLKPCKSNENPKSKIFENPILSSYVLYIEESKKKVVLEIVLKIFEIVIRPHNLFSFFQTTILKQKVLDFKILVLIFKIPEYFKCNIWYLHLRWLPLPLFYTFTIFGMYLDC